MKTKMQIKNVVKIHTEPFEFKGVKWELSIYERTYGNDKKGLHLSARQLNIGEYENIRLRKKIEQLESRIAELSN